MRRGVLGTQIPTLNRTIYKVDAGAEDQLVIWDRPTTRQRHRLCIAVHIHRPIMHHIDALCGEITVRMGQRSDIAETT